MKISIVKTSEKIIVVGIAVVTLFLMIASLHFERKLANQKLLYYQLQALRTSVSLFRVIEKRHPNDLIELVFKEYSFPDEDIKRPYLSNAMRDKDGRIVDPFGKPFIYDEKSGWVRSSTPGFEHW